MKTVRLPIYIDGKLDRRGSQLEIDLDYFMFLTRRGQLSQARIIEQPLAQWEKDIIAELEKDEGREVTVAEYIEADIELTQKLLEATHDEVGLVVEELEGRPDVDAEEWRDLEGIPTQFFEINQVGDIRHKGTGKIMELKMQPEQLRPAVKLIINRQDWWIDGPRLAQKMWNK